MNARLHGHHVLVSAKWFGLMSFFSVAGQFVRSGLYYSSNLVLPPVCVACSALVDGHGVACPRCWANLHIITPPICDRLGIPLPGSVGDGPFFSTDAIVNPPDYDRARAAAFYTGVMRRLIVKFKFEDRHEALPLFTSLLMNAGREILPQADVIVPVPLHPLRLLHRRYNQSALLALNLAKRSGKPMEARALRRVKRTRAQVGLDQAERRQNVAAAFAVSKQGAGRIAGKRVLLIDDVMTTGSTVSACALVLRNAGAAGVDVLALAGVTALQADEMADEMPPL